jgi:hypothetical protein
VSHSPYSRSIGTSIFALEPLALAEVMNWNGSGIGERRRCVRFVAEADGRARDFLVIFAIF